MFRSTTCPVGSRWLRRRAITVLVPWRRGWGRDNSDVNAWYILGQNPDPFPAELNVGSTEEVEHLSSAGFKVSEDSIKQVEASDPPHLQMRAQRLVRPGALTVSPYHAAPRLVIRPPTTDEKAVYAYATRRTTDESDKKEVLVDMLDTCAQQSAFAVEMVPRGWLSNHLLHLACKVIMEADKQRHGYITRHIFSPYFSEHIVVEFPDNVLSEQPVWSVARVEKFIKPPLLSDSISKCQMIFVPVLFQRHWICYVVNLRDRSVDVLDSMIKGRTKVHEELDDRVRERLDQVLHHAEEHLEFDIKSFPIKVVQVPQQSNNCDCGIFVIKFMELWDGYLTSEFDWTNSVLSQTTGHVVDIAPSEQGPRQRIVCSDRKTSFAHLMMVTFCLCWGLDYLPKKKCWGLELGLVWLLTGLD